MKTVSICALLSLLAVSTPASAADVRPAKPDMKLNVPEYNLNTQIFDFPTGLRIMMQSDRSHKVATVFTIVNHGTKDDPEGKEETAHFDEHTWFRSKHGSLPPVMDLIQDIGARFNATTRNDWTDFRTVASSEYLPLLMRLESLRLTEPYIGVTEAEIDIEREVIRNEWRRRNEQGQSMLFDYLYEAVYPEDHPYHDHSTHASIDNIKLADLQKFMDDYYTAPNTTILVVGDFAPEEAASLIFSNFAPELLHPRLDKDDYFYAPKPGITKPDQLNPDDWLMLAYDPDSPPTAREPFRFSTREVPRITEERPPTPPLGTTEVRTRQAPVEDKLVVVGWSLPGGFRSDHWNLLQVPELANRYIANGFRDELEQKRIGDVFCFAQPEIVNTTMLCGAELLDDKLDPLIIRDKMLDQLSEIWNPDNITGEGAAFFNTFFTRGKMEQMAGLLLNLDVFAQEFGGRGEDITPHAHYTNSVLATSDGMKGVMGMDPAAVSNLAFQYLKRDRAATVIIEPLPEDEIDIGSESSTYGGASAADSVLRSGDDLATVTNDQIAQSYIVPDMKDLVDFKLDNGMRVVVLKHGEAPLVQASVILGRNVTAEPLGLLDFAGSFTQSVGHDPLEIAAQPQWVVNPGIPGLIPGEGYPLWLYPGNTYGNALRLTMQAPSGNLDGALWMMREELETAKAYVDGKPRWIEIQQDGLKSEWADRTWHLGNARSRYLYPDAPWMQTTTWDDIEKMKAWSNTTLDEYLKLELQPTNATLLIVGNIDVPKAKEFAMNYFGGWKARPGAPAVPTGLKMPSMPTEPAKILVYDDPKRTQVDMNRACRLNVTDRSQEFKVDVLSSLLGNKVFTQMRVIEGLAYSPRAGASIGADGSAVLSFYSDGVVNTGLGRMIQYWNQALAEIEAGNVNPDEVTLHKLREARSVGVSAQSMGQVTDNLTQVLRYGEGWDFLNDRGELIASVQPSDLKGLVEGCAEHSITTMEGPKEIITAQLDELGLPYQVVEWKADGDELLWTHDPKAAKKKEKARQKAAKKKEKEDAKKGTSGDKTTTP